jgi:hypothetical protein
MLYVFTIATHEHGYFNSLKDSCERNNIELHVVGIGKKWEGWQTKMKYIRETLDLLSEDTIILYTDAYDSIIIGNEQEILDRYYSLNEPVIFSAYSGGGGFINHFFFGKPCGKNASLNAGGFIGRVKELKQLFDGICKDKKCIGDIDDQKIINQYCHKNPISLDTQNKLFYIFDWENHFEAYVNILQGKQSNLLQIETKDYKVDQILYCKKTNSYPIILHANNSGNMDLLLKQLNIKNTYKKPNYFQYSTINFIKPILFYLFCLVLLYTFYKFRMFHYTIKYVRKYNAKPRVYGRGL